MKLPSIFSDHMVLQRDRPVPVWGWDTPGKKIFIKLENQTRQITVDRNGRWEVRLAPLNVGKPLEMEISNGSEVIVIKDILVGEVWICSGQSNMEWNLWQTENGEAVAKQANHPMVRLFTVAQTAVLEPQKDVTGKWCTCAPASARTFSAVGYYFGVALQKKLKVPIGLINGSWGGTCAEAWTSREALISHPQFKPFVQKYEKELKHFKKHLSKHKAFMKKKEFDRYPADPGNLGHKKGWADPAYSTQKWLSIPQPGSWKQFGLSFNGVVWFRKEVNIPKSWEGHDLQLCLAACDKHDDTYFDGVRVGGIGVENPNAWSIPRVYKIPARMTQAGKHLIASRIYSYVYAGGMIGSESHMQLKPVDLPGVKAISLAGDWQYQVEHNFGEVIPVPMPLGPGNPNSPYSLFRGMIEPLIPYAIRGAIWYQGESNADRPTAYQKLFPLMIRSWRKAWKQGSFPFHFVQLANYQTDPKEPSDCNWARLREAQTQTLRLPSTGMAVAIDIGCTYDIHPKNKKDVGIRLAKSTLNSVYGFKEIIPSGPFYSSFKIKKGLIKISFEHIGKGLHAKGGKLHGFAIAGKDRKFVWAQARIEKNQVVVWHPEVTRPVAVRYAWGHSPKCSLYNLEGLPAVPFRTDSW